MANHQLLDNVTHKDTRVITSHHNKFGDNQSYTRLILSELRSAQSTYPLFLRKDSETGQFEIIAMFGLAEEENLFLDENGWHAHYVPLTVQRRPFLIGFQSSADPNTPEDTPVVHIDADSPRISDTEGEPIFLPQGGQSPYLQHISSILKTIHEGNQFTQPFVDILQSMELIEAVDLNIQLKNDNKLELGGLYTIHEEALRDLSDQQVLELHKRNYFELIYMMMASLQNMTKLIELKNARL